MAEPPRLPAGDLSIRTAARPADTNPSGEIFGGWVLSQMDIAGGIAAAQRAKGRTATVGVEAMTFHKPVHVGDIVCCYAAIARIGRTSIAMAVEAWVIRAGNFSEEQELVTEGLFTFVALDPDGRPRPVDP